MRCKPVAYAFIFALGMTGCGSNDSTTASSGSATTGSTTATGSAPVPAVSQVKDLKIEDVKPGAGPKAEAGDTVYVLYTGKLANGTIFDSTDKHGNKPFEVPVGGGKVIAGWDKGLVGIRKDGERNLSIPSSMGYGDAGSGETIPPKSDLFFNIKCLWILKKGDDGTIDATDKVTGTGATAKRGDKVTISYKGTLINGDVFDSTEKTGKPVTFHLGKKEVLDGLDAGIPGMKVGGERIINVPPKLGLPYGNQTIPPGSILIFDVKLIKVG